MITIIRAIGKNVDGLIMRDGTDPIKGMTDALIEFIIAQVSQYEKNGKLRRKIYRVDEATRNKQQRPYRGITGDINIAIVLKQEGQYCFSVFWIISELCNVPLVV